MPTSISPFPPETRNDGRSRSQVVEVDCTVRVTHKTGVEMEAMMGASVAALTVYDMLKGLSHDIVVEDTVLVSKTGGKRDFSRTAGEGNQGRRHT